MKVSLGTLVLCTPMFLSAQGPDATAPKRGTLSGEVVESKTGAPVKKATVTLQHNQEGVGTISDSEGKFTLRDLDPGSYVISVEREGYVTTHDSAQKVVTVNADDKNADVKLMMLRTGVISGRVLDVDGEPLVNARVQIAPVRSKPGQSGGTSASTNDLGEYRAFALAPGDYRVAASYEIWGGGNQIHMQKRPGAYAVTHYAGIAKVESGAELHGIDVQMARVHAVRVRGHVIGSPLFSVVTLQSIPQAGGSEHTAVVRGEKGDFELPDVLPGKYSLNAMGMVLDGEHKLMGQETIEVGDVDVDDVQIVVGPPKTVSGSFTIPEGRKLPNGLMVVLGSQSREGSLGGGMGQVASDGTFTMKDVPPGDYDVFVRSSGASDDLYISAIKMGATDALADGVHITDSAPGQLDVVLKANGGSATCSVVDDKGTAVPLAHVVLAPDTPKNREFALYGECNTESNGSCKITGITPGDYHLYAFPSGMQTDYQDSDLFKTYEATGKAVNVIESQEQQVQIAVIVEE